MSDYVKKEKYDELKEAYDGLKHELDQLKRLIFGSKSERYNSSDLPGQLTLDFDLSMSSGLKQSTELQQIPVKNRKPSKAIARHPLPKHLPRSKMIIEPEEDTSNMKLIGEEVTELLAKLPSRYFVLQIIRRKYAKADGQGVVIGAMPSRAIEKGMVHNSLLADMIVSKYADHLPLYRQAKILAREDVHIPSSTMSDWIAACGRLLEPLYEALKKEVLSSDYLQVDESPIKVQDKKKKGSTHRGYQWVYHDVGRKLVLFDYQKGRGREGPINLLKNYKGYIQTDGYKVYDQFGHKPGITLLGCMAHARRYFEQALNNDEQRAKYFLEHVQQLYQLEKNLKEQPLDWDQVLETRQRLAMPILDNLKRWLLAENAKVLPKSAIGKAIKYSLSRWDKLCRYAGHGGLQIDNNLIENQIRPLALGRKNYLFAGSHKSAKHMAIFYSILGSCRSNGINPYDYLSVILDELPQYPINKISELLPCHVIIEKAKG